MQQSKIGFIARDGGPSNLLGCIAEEARSRGIETVELLRTENIGSNYDLFIDCTTILIGIHAFENVQEVTAAYLLRQVGKEIFFVEDTFRAGLRANLDNCEFPIISAMTGYEDDLHAYGYTKVQNFGYPAHWEKEYLAISDPGPAKHFRYQVKEDEEVYVLIGGGKFPDLNNLILRTVLEQLDQMSQPYKFSFCPHPGEKENMTAHLSEKRGGLIYSHSMQYIDRGTCNTAQVFAVADIGIFFDATTLSIGGAFARKPMVMIYNDRVRAELKKLGIEGRWFVEELGAMHGAEIENSPAGLKLAINESLNDIDISPQLLRRRPSNFNLPEDWGQAGQIIDELCPDSVPVHVSVK